MLVRYADLVFEQGAGRRMNAGMATTCIAAPNLVKIWLKVEADRLQMIKICDVTFNNNKNKIIIK